MEMPEGSKSAVGWDKKFLMNRICDTNQTRNQLLAKIDKPAV